MGSAQHPDELAGVSVLFDSYLDGSIPGLEFPSRLSSFLGSYDSPDRKGLYESLLGVAFELEKRGKETGEHYDVADLITPQELALTQSGDGEAGISPTAEPYMPFIFDTRAADVNRLNEQRSRTERWVLGLYYELGDGYVRISLEPLDGHGRTVRDPVPLDEAGTPLKQYIKSKNFPFRRD